MMLIQCARRTTFAAATAMLGFAFAACNDGPVASTGAIQVMVDPASLSVEQGGSGTVTVAVTRSGFGGTVRLAIAGLPSGVTATITPAELSNEVSSATLEMNVDVSVAAGDYLGTVTASADGIDDATTTCALSITATPGYALSVEPAMLSIAAGASSSATVDIVRTNFAGDVTLALAGPPVGITGDFSVTSAAASAAALIVNVSADVTAGSYALVIEGTSDSLGVRSATLTIVVPSLPPGANVDYQFCDASAAPVYFAFQDGNGAWQSVAGLPSGNTTHYAFNLTQGHGGILMVFGEGQSASPIAASSARARRPAALRSRTASRRLAAAARVALRDEAVATRSFAGPYVTEVLLATTAELAQDGLDNCAQTQPLKTVTGSVVGVPQNGYGILSFGYTTEIFIGGTSTNPVTFDVEGISDLTASRMAVAGTPPDRIVVLRNLDVPDGATLPWVIDFDGPASSVPATATVTTTGAGGDDLEVYTDLVTANSRLGLWFDLDPSQVSTRPWAGLGATAMQSGDFHGLVVFATPPNRPLDYRVTLEYVRSVADRTLALGPDIDEPTSVQIAGGAYPRFRFQGTLPPEYGQGASIDLLRADESGNAFSIIASGAYLAASGSRYTYDLEIPDVAGLAGFPIDSRLSAGINNVVASGFGFDGPGTFDLRPTLGATFRAAARTLSVEVGQ